MENSYEEVMKSLQEIEVGDNVDETVEFRNEASGITKEASRPNSYLFTSSSSFSEDDVSLKSYALFGNSWEDTDESFQSAQATPQEPAQLDQVEVAGTSGIAIVDIISKLEESTSKRMKIESTDNSTETQVAKRGRLETALLKPADVSKKTEEGSSKLGTKRKAIGGGIKEKISKLFQTIKPTSKGKYGAIISFRTGEQMGPHADYTLVRQLGFGTFSTVWLCRSQRDLHLSAIKVSKGNMSCSNVEFETLVRVNKVNPEHPGSENVVKVLGCFKTQSNLGFHMCIKMELLGPSLAELVNMTRLKGSESETVKNIIKQVLMGLDYLHSCCRLIHADLKPGNIAMTLNGSFPPEESFGIYKYNEIKWSDEIAMENNGVTRIPTFRNPHLRIKIVDLGMSVTESDERRRSGLIQSSPFRSIEVLIGDTFSFSADIWSLGCITYELLSGQQLFYPVSTPVVSCDESHLSLITQLMGDIPIGVALRGKFFKRLFNSDGVLRCRNKGRWRKQDLKKFFINVYNWDEMEATNFQTFMFALLEPNQTLRITAGEALKNRWLNQ